MWVHSWCLLKIILTVYTCANDHLVQDTHNIHDDYVIHTTVQVVIAILLFICGKQSTILSRLPPRDDKSRHCVGNLMYSISLKLAVSIQQTFQLPIQGTDGLCHNLLHSPALSPGAVRRKTISPDTTSSANTGGEDVVRVKVVTTLQLVWIQVSLVFSILHTATERDHYCQDVIDNLLWYLPQHASYLLYVIHSSGVVIFLAAINNISN